MKKWSNAPLVAFLAALALHPACGEDGGLSEVFGAPAADDADANEKLGRIFPEFFPDNVRHSVPLGAIFHGGPPKDGIPALTRPNVIPAAAADYLDATDVVLGLELNGETRAYPLLIMNWHEIVNDTLGGVPVALTYCPLCGTGIAFDPVIDGVAVEFGVSGLLHNSDLLMYDRATDTPSLWQQALGRAVVGPQTGAKLTIMPVAHARWGEWSAIHPDTTVLSTDTGYGRNYARDPYAGYADDPVLFFPVDGAKPDLPRKTWVYGLIHNGQTRAYPLERFGQLRAANDVVGGEGIVVITGEGSPPGARVYQRGLVRFALAGGVLTDADGGVWQTTETELLGPNGESLRRLTEGFVAFWFAWSAFYPGTDIYDGTEPDPVQESQEPQEPGAQRIEGFGPDRWGRLKDAGADG
jgi:hypothetical protein